jgi:antagonist of KipI
MSLQIIKQGMLDTVQDVGRFGHQHLGIGPNGAMDSLAARIANMLVNNEMHEAVIEMHFPASTFLIQQRCLLALAGADFGVMLNEKPIALHEPFIADAGSILSFSKYNTGARCYLAIHRGLEIEAWLNSKSTHLKAHVGGFNGRALMKDDMIPFNIKYASTLSIDKQTVDELKNWVTKKYVNNKIEIIEGTAFTDLQEEAKAQFLQNEFLLTPQSDRMGFRLNSEPLNCTQKDEMLSTGVTKGTIQLLPNGQLIVLMADHQTTGGYPMIAHVASIALHRMAQKRINEKISFEMVTLEKAQALYLQQKKEMMEWERKIKPPF